MLKRIIAILSAGLTTLIFSKLGTPEGCALFSGALAYLLSIQLLNRVQKSRPDSILNRSFVQLLEA